MAITGSASVTLTATDGISGNTALTKIISGLNFTGTDIQYRQAQQIGVAAPTSLAVTVSSTGGSLAAGTYYWKVTGLNGAGETTGSNEVSGTTTGTTSSAAFTWNAMPGATSYRIYRGTSPGGESVYFTSITNSFTDTGASGTSGTVPGSNTTGSTWTPTLSQTPLQILALHNLSTTNTMTLAVTPSGGSSGTVGVFPPNGLALLVFPTAVSGGGISSFTVTVSPGTAIEGLWVS